MLKLVILADDFTGALDTAAKLASRRIPCFVTSDRGIFSSDLPSGYEVLTIDTESRHASPEQAYSLYRNLCRRWEETPYLYVKTDSVLRGNLSASLAGASEGLGRPVAFVPAFPSAGRVTRGGRHFVDGLPLEQSAFAADPLNPAVTSDISSLLSRDYPLSVQLVPEGEEVPNYPVSHQGQVLLFDCSSGQEMARIGEKVRAGGLLRLTAGCAGFASRFPELLSFREANPRGISPGGVFLLSGSANAATYRQLDYGEAHGWEILSPQWEDILEGNPGPVLSLLEESFCRTGGRAALAVSRSREQAEGFTRFAADHGMGGRQLHDRIQAFLRKLVPAALERLPVRTFAVFGGDSLFSSLDALGCRSLEVQGEMENGVPFALVKVREKEYTVISKSGGLGSGKVLDAIRDWSRADGRGFSPADRQGV